MHKEEPSERGTTPTTRFRKLDGRTADNVGKTVTFDGKLIN
jgi:hypothetical protein